MGLKPVSASNRVVAIIQARMGSTRLPGKILLPLGTRSVLGHVISRVRSCAHLNQVVVATTTSPADDAVVTEATRWGAPAVRGSERDVLSRYFDAASAHGADVVVRITSDCPLFDPELLSAMLRMFSEAAAGSPPVDYLSNTLQRTYPRGLDAEIFTFQALACAHREASRPYEREHVTPFFYQHPERFRLRNFAGVEDLSAHRWTLDTPEDLRFMEAVFSVLDDGRLFPTAAALELLRARPELSKLNAHVEQKPLA